MEKPGELKSTIYTKDNLIIITPKRKSYVVIFFLSLLSIQTSFGLFVSIIHNKEKPPEIAMFFMIVVFGTIFFFAFREVLWQIKGRNIITVTNNTLTITKKGSYLFKEKVCDVKEVKNLSVNNNPETIGPLAMLQLLRVIDITKVTFNYGFKTVKLVSGIDPAELEYIIVLLEQEINKEV